MQDIISLVNQIVKKELNKKRHILSDNSKMEIKDSGKREHFSSGAVRDIRQKKGRFDLLPFYAMESLSRHFEKGALKYGDRNWEKGMPQSRFFDSAMRHLMKFGQGMKDEDHLLAALWNISCMVDQRQRFKLKKIDKRFNDFG
jgi:hypothetical protein